jgi:long-chain acyl-CoA synthetase
MCTIQRYFSGKTVLVTGATGFLGKALLEKMLRSLPDVRRLYLLIRGRQRGTRPVSAADRFRAELLKSSVFDGLKGQLGEGFDDYVDQRVAVIAGDLSDERLGVSDDDYCRLTEETQVLINSAAVVVFDERLDLSLNLNTLGARRMLDFARACRQLEATIHISTCYVSGKTKGWVDEDVKPFAFDADLEADRLWQECLAVKQQYQGQDELLKQKLVELGLKSARARGWHDTYTFTKALGEQLVLKHRGDLATVILRPAIIESSLAEPEPGWIDGFRMADPLFVGYGKGYLQDFPGNPNIIADLIPCDHVVNAILAAVPVCAAEKGFKVYQVASGEHNPVQFRTIYNVGRDYFKENPLHEKDGTPIATGTWTWPDTASYRRKLIWKYRNPLIAARALLRPLSFIRSVNKLRQRLKVKRAALDLLLYYVDIYSPYTTIESRYHAGNTAALWASLPAEDQQVFPFDVRGIDWRDYIANIHIPGLKKNVLNLAPDDVAEGTGSPVRTIPELLSRSADRYPEAVALQMKRHGEWTRLTYDELERRVTDVSATLHELGVHKGDRVLLYAENSPEWGVAYLAVVSLGAVVVPVDRQLAESEVLAIARFVEARALLASPGSHEGFGEETQHSTTTPLLNLHAGCKPFDPALAPAPSAQHRPPSALVAPDDLASILFTTSVSGRDPRGVMLTHRNFLSNVMGVVQVLPPKPADNFLSILPLHHALEFTGGFLVPLYAGARITYCESMRSRVLLDTMRETQATCLIGAPRVFQVVHDALRGAVAEQGKRARLRFDALKVVSKLVRLLTGRNVGRRLYAAVHEKLGGKLRAFISGGAPLAPQIFDDFTALGFELCEGYGLTETAPIATANPLHAARKGSVGVPLPGVEVRILRPDERGVGEIAVRGPNVTAGYYRNPAATEHALRDGWLHTGDVGYFDKQGYLHLTGRIKEMIVTPAGKNVYPDEVEQIYANLPGVRQLCVVGLWDDDVLGETIHAVIVPEPGKVKGGAPFEETLRQAIQLRGRGVPRYQRLQRLHIVNEELPRTLAGGIDRNRVQQQLLERLRSSGLEGVALPRHAGHEGPLHEELGSPVPPASVTDGVLTTVARVARVPRSRIAPESNLEADLRLDPLAMAELLLELETQFQAPIPETLAPSLHTVGDVLDAVKQRVEGGGVAVAERTATTGGVWGRVLRPKARADEDYWLRTSWAEAGVRAVTRRLMKLYAWGWFRFEVRGREHLPPGAFIVASNHCSHLDTGAVVTAFGDRGHELFIMGARDYFFNRRLKGWFFHTFLNVIPFDRSENVIEGLRLAQAVLRAGRPVLIYPEGRRSATGELQSFKAGIGLLGVELGVPIVPCYVEGTHAALPKGRTFPRHAKIRVTFAPPVTMDEYRSRYADLDRRELWRRVAEDVRGVVEQLQRQGRQA